MFIVKLCKYFRQTMAFANLSGWAGVAISGAITITWLITLGWSLSWDLTSHVPGAIALWLALRTVLHTGLFVVAHDAMHGNILPNDLARNHRIGQLALGLYGFLPYQGCRRLHWQHHTHPGRSQDPDFFPNPDGHVSAYFIRWYFNFMGNYLTPQNLPAIVAGIGLTTLASMVLFKVTIHNLLLFWLLPWVLSSLQLFTFGIFLPHYSDGKNLSPQRPRSFYYPIIFSLITCYHFSYHREHHLYPHIPWYWLPFTGKISVCQISSHSLLNHAAPILPYS